MIQLTKSHFLFLQRIFGNTFFFFFSLFLKRKKLNVISTKTVLRFSCSPLYPALSLYPICCAFLTSCGPGTPVIVSSSQVHLDSPMHSDLPGLTLLENSTHAWTQKDRRLSVCSGAACVDLRRSSMPHRCWNYKQIL